MENFNLDEEGAALAELKAKIRELKANRRELARARADAEEISAVEWEMKRLESQVRSRERRAADAMRELLGKSADAAEAGRSFLVAAASTNGKRVNLHIKDARAFHIFRVEGGEVAFVERRILAAYEAAKMDYKRALAGCDAVIATKIPGRFSKKILEAGVRPVAVEDDFIDSAILNHINEITGM
jgi:predicted Fe-Mo cluster-binding NifX family protein